NAQLDSGNPELAEESYRRAIKVLEEPARRAPDNRYFLRQHLDAIESMGRYYVKLSARQPELRGQAREWLEKAHAQWKDWTEHQIALPYSTKRQQDLKALLVGLK